MANIVPTKVPQAEPNSNIILIKWEGLNTTDVNGEGVQLANFADKTVQGLGIFGASAIWTLQGSNDSTNGVNGTWGTLKSISGSDVAIDTVGEVDIIVANPLWIRPARVSGGDGSTDVDIYIAARRP